MNQRAVAKPTAIDIALAHALWPGDVERYMDDCLDDARTVQDRLARLGYQVVPLADAPEPEEAS